MRFYTDIFLEQPSNKLKLACSCDTKYLALASRCLLKQCCQPTSHEDGNVLYLCRLIWWPLANDYLDSNGMKLKIQFSDALSGVIIKQIVMTTGIDAEIDKTNLLNRTELGTRSTHIRPPGL